MSNLNKVFLMGRLTRDPEQRSTKTGQSVANFGLAINRNWTKDGEKREEVTFVDIEAWGNTAETLVKYVHKGDPLFVEGRLKFDTWEKDGVKRSKLRVVLDNFQFLSSKSEAGESVSSTPQGGFAGGGEAQPATPPADPEDVPF